MVIAATPFGAQATTCKAGCTIPAFGNGVETASTNGCTADTVIGNGATCDVKLKDGYDGSGSVTYSCNADGSALTGGTLAATGCLANFYQATGSGASDGVCTPW